MADGGVASVAVGEPQTEAEARGAEGEGRSGETAEGKMCGGRLCEAPAHDGAGRGPRGSARDPVVRVGRARAPPTGCSRGAPQRRGEPDAA